jgi:Dolichyl-phosphate-mannose-protein mannosyltransferase
MTTKTSNARAGSDRPVGKFSQEIRALVVLVVVTLACLCPFLGKAFHIDDPLFIWSAKHIISEPGNFYNFNANWSGRSKPMSEVTQNPPLASYYMALVGLLFGWSELALHAGFLLPALAVAWGTYRLAQHFCAHPLAAALATVTAPVFLVSSTSVMCDTTMLALWTWSLVFWTEGLEKNSPAKLCASAALIAACGLTKYFGFALIPLVAAYSLMERRKVGTWLTYLLIPVVVMAFYEWLTHKLYGRGSLSDAYNYAQNQGGADLSLKLMAGLAFSGGSIIILLPAAPLLCGRRTLGAGCAVIVLFGLFLVAHKKFGQMATVEAGQVNWLFVIQAALFVAAGVVLFLLAAADLWRQKSADPALLFFWIAGTFVFVCVACWQMSGRYLLPMLPAAAILLVRRLELRKRLHDRNQIGPLWVPLGVSLAIALMAARSDFQLAGSTRDAALHIEKQAGPASHAVWFEGHWGFQYYMEELGAKPIDFWHVPFATHNDAIILPLENSCVFDPPKEGIESWFEYDCDTSKWLTTMNQSCGAGFYSGDWGPLPFVFCRVPQDHYVVYRAK